MRILQNKLVVAVVVLLIIGGGVLFFNSNLKQADKTQTKPEPGSDTAQIIGHGKSNRYQEFFSKEMIQFIDGDADAVIKSDRGAGAILKAATVKDVKELLDSQFGGEVSYGDVTEGNASSDIIITDLISGNITIAKLEVSQLNLEAVNGLKVGKWEGDEPIFARMKAQGLAMTGKTGGKIDAKTVELGSFSMQLPGSFDDETFGEGEEPQNYVMRIAHFISRLSIDGIIIKDVHSRVKTTENDSETNALEELRVGLIDGGLLQHVLIKKYDSITYLDSESLFGKQYDDNTDGISLRSLYPFLALEELTIAGLLPYLKSGKAPARTARNLIKIGTFYSGASKSYVNDEIYTETMAAHMAPIEFVGLVPENIIWPSTAATLYIKPFLDAFSPRIEENLGAGKLDEVQSILEKYDLFMGIHLLGDANWNFEVDTEAVELSASLASQQLVDSELSFAITGLPLHDILADAMGLKNEGVSVEEDLQSMIAQTTFNSFEFKITEHQLIPLAFDIAAMNMPGTGGQIRASAPLLISIGVGSMADDVPQLKKFAETLGRFIANGGTLTVMAHPEKPVPISQLLQQDPAKIIDLLGLQVIHTE